MIRTSRTLRLVATTAAALSVVAGAVGCSRAQSADSAPASDQGAAAELRLGYFPNVTHAPALIGLEKGFYARELGSTTLVPTTFNAGGDAISALFGGSIDATFIGSGPAINGFDKSRGKSVRLVAGAASKGAQLVVKPEIATVDDLRGKTVVTPQLGNTQDVALKKYLADKQLTDQVDVQNTENALALEEFRKGGVQAAWLPEPWSSRLVLEAGAKVLLDEKELWPDRGDFPTTVLIVRTEYLQQHPETVKALIKGLSAAVDLVTSDLAGAKEATNAQLAALSGKPLPGPVIDRAFGNITFGLDPFARLLPQLAKDAETAKIAKSTPDLHGFVAFGPLNAVLSEAGKPAVDAAGLDKK